MTVFEGSFLGHRERIDDGTVLECGVCWWVYDPRVGDAVWQIPAGTAFTALPDHWRCPNCDAAQTQFMVLETASTTAAEQKSAGQQDLDALQRRLHEAYSAVAERMRELPVYREGFPLTVRGLHRCEYGTLGVLCTPWCMNLLLIAMDGDYRVEGSTRDLAFPSGSYPFTAGQLAAIGPIESCSLFSPMDDFEDGAAVETVADEVLHALRQTEDAQEPSSDDSSGVNAPPADPDRRRFFSGGLSAR